MKRFVRRRAVTNPKKITFLLSGGPYHATLIRLTSGSTLIFKTGQFRGRYMSNGRYGRLDWEECAC